MSFWLFFRGQRAYAVPFSGKQVGRAPRCSLSVLLYSCWKRYESVGGSTRVRAMLTICPQARAASDVVPKRFDLLALQAALDLATHNSGIAGDR